MDLPTLLRHATAPMPKTSGSRCWLGHAIAECDLKLAQYRAALDAGANPASVAGWIAETEAEKAAMALIRRRPEPRPRLTEQEIRSIVEKFADIARVLTDADPDDTAEIFGRLGPRLTYHPGRRAGRRVQAKGRRRAVIVRAGVRQSPGDGLAGQARTAIPHAVAEKFIPSKADARLCGADEGIPDAGLDRLKFDVTCTGSEPLTSQVIDGGGLSFYGDCR
ncbi:MAG: hypothetical protein WAK82_33835 [Streptosporangiaceae bacterium]